MPKLIVTVGLPCSGKSEYALALHKDTGAYLVSVGDVRKEMRDEDPDTPERKYSMRYLQELDIVSNTDMTVS